MDNLQYAARLRYLDADDVDDAVVDYDGLDVHGPDGKKIGDVDGFIVDAAAQRVYYIVVDSGGWFSSRRFLLPVGHGQLTSDRRALQVDVTRDTLNRYPEFHEDRFSEFSDEELRTFERATAAACCPDEPLDDVSAATWGYDTRRHYRQPDWWSGKAYRQERLRPVAARDYTPATTYAPEGAAAAGALAGSATERERIRAREDDRLDDDRRDDVSPHFDGRAQPGDVLGIETGGERTSMGETAEDENKRRRSAERAGREDEEPRRSDR